jgi:hypothetical protein
MNNKANTIINGCVKSNTGYRQVLFSKTLEVRPVLLEIKSGYQPDRGTIQVSPVIGDVLIRSSWRSNCYQIDISKWDGQNFISLTSEALYLYYETEWEGINDPTGVVKEYVTILKTAKELNPWLEEFLQQCGRQGSFIPCEQTLVEKAKKDRLTKFFKKHNLPYLEKIDSFMSSPKGGLKLESVDTPADLLEHVPSYITHDGSVVSISKKEYWFAISQTGTFEVPVTYQQAHRSNYAHEKPSFSEGKSLRETITDIESVKFLIKIVHGAYTRDHYSFGRTIDVYRL